MKILGGIQSMILQTHSKGWHLTAQNILYILIKIDTEDSTINVCMADRFYQWKHLCVGTADFKSIDLLMCGTRFLTYGTDFIVTPVYIEKMFDVVRDQTTQM